MGLCSNTAEVEVFVGSAPESPNLLIDPTVCSSSSLELVWQGLSNYAFGTAWSLEVEGVPSFSGLVNGETSDTLVWEFGEVTDCVEALGSVSFYAEAVNTCSSPTEPSVGSARKCASPSRAHGRHDHCWRLLCASDLQVGDDTFCPDLQSYAWGVTQDGGPPH